VKRRLLALFVISLIVSILLKPNVAFSAAGYLRGVNPDGFKTYLGSTPPQSAEALEQFRMSSGSEAQKLFYLLERFKEIQDHGFYYLGNRYSWQDAFLAGSWMLNQRYSKIKNARSFIKDQFSLLERPTNPVLIEFPDGTLHRAYDILINELDFLEASLAN
jgi:hypothetical protein